MSESTGEWSDSSFVPMPSLLAFGGGARVRDGVLKMVDLRHRPRSYWFRGEANFGDEMAPTILAWASGLPPVWVTRKYRGKILGQGSVLRYAREGDLIWGTGSMNGQPFEAPLGCRILAVRGPLTRQAIQGDVPEIYGDPALLLPRFHNHLVEKVVDVGVVPHYVDRESVLSELGNEDPAIRIIDVHEPWQRVVDAIRSCHAIISSSLHGLIVAEAYGIPASWVRVTDRVSGGVFKFNDYYLATGRDEQSPTTWSAGIATALARAAPTMVADTDPLITSIRRAIG